MKEVYIQGGLRTPIGQVGGQYKAIQPEILGSRILNQLRHTYHLDCVDSIMCGNAVGTGGNIGRLMTLESKFPNTVPAVSIDMQCASAAMAIEMAYSHIASQMSHTIIAGGIESSSLQPKRTYADLDKRQGDYYVAQFSPNENDPQAMLWGAERTIQKYGIQKEDLDPHVLRSHALASQAAKAFALDFIILPTIVDGNYCNDECIRSSMSQRLLNRMPLLLGPGTLTTAANACLTHDGAAFLVLTDQESEFRIHDIQAWSGDPLYSPEGAWKSSEAILKKTGMTMDDMDAIEWNEAFAVIDVLFERNYEKLLDRYNLLGGALAYGHPYGASGAIILLHLMTALRRRQGQFGLAAIAGAGGSGVAMIIERLIK